MYIPYGIYTNMSMSFIYDNITYIYSIYFVAYSSSKSVSTKVWPHHAVPAIAAASDGQVGSQHNLGGFGLTEM